MKPQRALPRSARARRDGSSSQAAIEALEARRLLSTTLGEPDPVLPDALEPNDSFANAWNLGLTTRAVAEDLTIHLVNGIANWDVFRFTAPLTTAVAARISYAANLGGLGLDLFGPDQQPISAAVSQDPQGQQAVFRVEEGQSYYVRVRAGAAQGQYQLNLEGLSDALSYDWRMADRFSAGLDAFGLPIVPNTREWAVPNPITINGRQVPRYQVFVNADTSLGGGGFTHSWTFIGPHGPVTATGAATSVLLPEGDYTVTHNVQASSVGIGTARSSRLEVRDILFVAIGDSYSSGEGNPHRPQQFFPALAPPLINSGARTDMARWMQSTHATETSLHARAHRSAHAGVVQAARALELADPKTSVTFVFLSHTGSQVTTGLFDPIKGGDADNPDFGPPQLEKMQQLVGDQPIDALTVSIGGNDIGFADILSGLTLGTPAREEVFRTAEAKLAELANVRYPRLAARLDDFDIGQVFLTEYPDITRQSDGQTASSILFDIIPGFSVNRSELDELRTRLMFPLIDVMRDAAADFGWTYADGVNAGFARSQYGTWFRSATDSHILQGPATPTIDLNNALLTLAQKQASTGTMHPIGQGLTVKRDVVLEHLRQQDLRASEFFLSDTATLLTGAGQFFIRVTNASPVGSSQASVAHLYLSGDTTIGPNAGDALVAAVDVPALGPGESVLLNGSVPASFISDPFRQSGEVYFDVVVDPFNKLAETNEANNRPLDGSGTVARISDRDLVRNAAGGLVVSPLAIAANQPRTAHLGIDEIIGAFDLDAYTFTVGVQQRFDIDLDSSMDTVLRVYAGLPTPGAIPVFTSDNQLGPGEAGGNAQDAFLRQTLAPGTYTIVVSHKANETADPAQIIGRSAGQQGPYTLSVTAAPPALPDLSVTQFAIAPDAFLGTANPDWSVRVHNSSWDTASPASTVEIYLSGDRTIASNDVRVLTIDVPALAPEESFSLSGFFTPRTDPFRFTPILYVGWIVDRPGAVTEISETNNTSTSFEVVGIQTDRHLTLAAGSTTLTQILPDPMAIGQTRAGALGDEFIGGADVDVFSFSGNAGQRIGIDLDGLGNFDTAVRVYAAGANVGASLAENDDALSPIEPTGNPLESYAELVLPATGSYFVVVSQKLNRTTDPNRIGGRAVAPTGNYTLTLEDVDLRPKPDLRVTAFPLPASAFLAGSQYSVTVDNTGVAPAYRNQVQLFLSQDAAWDAADVLAQTITVGDLAAGQARTLTGALQGRTDPFRTTNQVYVIAVIDPTGFIAEDQETNNRLLSPTVLVPDRDLAPVTLQPIFTPIALGETIDASFGDEFIGGYDMDFYTLDLQAGQTIGIDTDIQQFVFNNTYLRLYRGSIAPDNLVAFNNDATARDEPLVATSESFIEYTADLAGTYVIVVSGSTNGTRDPLQLSGRAADAANPYTLRVYDDALRPRPDLTWDELRLAKSSLTAQGIQYSVTFFLRNLGLAIAPETRIWTMLSLDPQITTDDFLLREWPFGWYPANRSGAIGSAFIPPSDPFRSSNTLYIGGILDPTNVIPELSETNNTSNVTVLSSEEHLTPGPIDGSTRVVGTPIAPGQTLSAGIGDELIGAYDIDVFTFDVLPGQTLAFDLDQSAAFSLSDTYVRLYAGDQVIGGTPLAINDDGLAPGETNRPAGESYLEYTFAEGGRYSLVVSHKANGQSDVTTLAGRAAGQAGLYTIGVTDLSSGPLLVSRAFNVGDGRLRYTFDRALPAGVSGQAVRLLNLTTNAVIDLVAEYLPGQTALHLRPANRPAGLPSGQYIATLLAGPGDGRVGTPIESQFSFHFLRGDMNNDGAVNNQDIAPFVQGLTDPAAFTQQFGYPPVLLGDVNEDAAFNNQDIAAFVSLLTGSRPAATSPAPAPRQAPASLFARPTPFRSGPPVVAEDEVALLVGSTTAAAVTARPMRD